MPSTKTNPSGADFRQDELPDSLPGPLMARLLRLRNRPMSNWIKVEKCSADKPEILNMAIELGISPEAVLGHCIRFWCWCDDHQKSGLTMIADTAVIDAIARRDGFGLAMISVGWLKIVSDKVVISHFERHLGNSAKNRAIDAVRKQKHRASSKP